MKRKLVILLAAAMVMSTLSGCGSKADPEVSTESSATEDTAEDTAEDTVAADDEESLKAAVINVKDINLEEYMTLGEYNGVEVSMAAPEVSDEEVEAEVENLYYGLVTMENGGVVDRAVEVGDTVNIDYTGKKEDVAFEGGTASGATLSIGSGQFIDGFEEGLVGVMPGETVDLNLTFPDPYQNAELAGADVVFTVTVNYIEPTEMKDEVVAGFASDDYTNLDEMRQHVRASLEQDAKDYLEQNYDAILEGFTSEAVINNCTFTSLPEDYVAQHQERVMNNLLSAASMYGVDPDTYTRYFYGVGAEDFARQNAEIFAKQCMAFQAIADKEGMSLTEEELQSELEQFAADAGAESVDQLLEVNSMEEFEEYFLMQKVISHVIENAVITE